MKRLFIFAILITAGIIGFEFLSNGGLQHRSVKQYGTDRFVRDALSFRQSGKLPSPVQEALAPKKTVLKSRGVFLIYRDSGATTEGIYVDPVNLSTLDNLESLISSSIWTPRIAWIKEKRNQTPEYFKHTKSTIETARGFKERRPEVPDEL